MKQVDGVVLKSAQLIVMAQANQAREICEAAIVDLSSSENVVFSTSDIMIIEVPGLDCEAPGQEIERPDRPAAREIRVSRVACQFDQDFGTGSVNDPEQEWDMAKT